MADCGEESLGHGLCVYQVAKESMGKPYYDRLLELLVSSVKEMHEDETLEPFWWGPILEDMHRLWRWIIDRRHDGYEPFSRRCGLLLSIMPIVVEHSEGEIREKLILLKDHMLELKVKWDEAIRGIRDLSP